MILNLKGERFFTIMVVVFIFFLYSHGTIQAESIISGSNGDYQLNDLVGILINSSQLILGIVGSLALLMFVYGGTIWLISSGSSEMVTKGKNIIIGAVIGIVIVFTSYMIIQFSMQTLGYIGVDGKPSKGSQNEWNTAPQ